MKRWFVRAAVALTVLAAAVLASGWLLLRASLPDLDGTLALDGISEPARIERDAYGIPTITASNRQDLAFATGFAHGQDRFFQMDLIRRRAAGELSAIIGSATVATDKAYRFHRFRARALRQYARLNDEQRALLDAYAAGANAGLDSLGARPFEYWLLGVEPTDWKPEDSILILYAMFMTLNDSRASRDVRRSYIRRVFPDSVYSWLYPDGTDWDAPVIGAPRTPGPVPPPTDLSLRSVTIDREATPDVSVPPIPGSNNWAVSGALTANGQALVSNDMHLGISVPNIYYQARLITTGSTPRDIMGVTLPGSPFVVAGSNPYMAWGYTNSYGDWTDAVLLKPGTAPETYITPDGDRKFVTVTETIEVKNGDDVAYDIRETVWGPVDDRANYVHGDIAVSWTAHHAEAVNINIVYLETAASVNEAVEIANTMGIPPQNFVTGDREGNIAWTIAGAIPRRTDFDPLLPVDWSTEAGWSGWLAPDEYPRVINPESGRLWTANSRVVDGDMLERVGNGGYDRGARAQQIRDSLFARNEFVAADMLAIQTDHRALFLSRWQGLLVGLLDRPEHADDDVLSEYLKLTKNWMPTAAPESVGYRLVRGFRLEVQERLWSAVTAPVRDVYGDDVDLWRSGQFEAALWQMVSEQPEHLLPANFPTWDAFLVDAVRTSVDYYESEYESPLTERTWGERNTANIQHPLSLAVPALSRWLDMPRDTLAGDADLPLAQSPGFGASERFSVSPGDRASGLMHMPTGQSGHPLSPYYRRGHDDWVHGRESPFLPGDARHSLVLEPSG